MDVGYRFNSCVNRIEAESYSCGCKVKGEYSFGSKIKSRILLYGCRIEAESYSCG